jgi:translation initiation factor 2 subunit 3
MNFNMQEIMQHQAVINLGMVGHVANGKTTITQYMTGITTTKHSSEKTQNKTIRLGYANFKIWKCSRCNAYESTGSGVYKLECDCKTLQYKILQTHISVVDCPGHNMLMSTMLNGSSVMDYTMLIESATNKDCPAPQTAEHFQATKIAGIPNAMILMNKIDIVKREKIENKIDLLEEYVRNETGCTDKSVVISPIVPVSATFGTNLDVVCEYLSHLTIPKSRNSNGVFEMLIIRSFDINKPGISGTNNNTTNKSIRGTDVRKIKGGVIGGSIMRGNLKLSDKLVILPGRCQRLSAERKEELKNECEFKTEIEADFTYEPIRCTVKSIQSEKNDMKLAIAGGLLAVQVTIDPAHTRNDGLTGSIVLKESDYLLALENKSNDYKVYDKVIIKMDSFMNKLTDKKIKLILQKDTMLKININSNTIKAMVLKYSKTKRELRLFIVKPIPISILNDAVTVMLDKSSKTNKENTEIDDIDTSVLGVGKIIDGVEAIRI